MFACTRRASKKAKEKVDFSIHFQATQIHTAWDKLAVSLVSLDSGRVTNKTRKAPVRNGQCTWPDAVLETAKLVLDMKTHLYDEKLYKFVVAKGFSRSCILGEVIVNITEYVTAASPTSLILPLRFCYAGTLLHVKIHCLNPKSLNKPYSWLNAGHVSDTDTEIHSACGTPLHPFKPSPSHYLCRAYSAGSRSPVASSATGECSRAIPSSPTLNTGKKSGIVSISYISLSSPTSAVTPPPRNAGHAVSTDATMELENWKCIAETLQKDLAAQKHELADLKVNADMHRSSYLEERKLLQSELDELKIRNDELMKRPECVEHIRLIDELKEELDMEKDNNTGLNIQLQKLRNANMDLLVIVRDLEDSLEEHTRDTERLLKCKVYNNPCAEVDGALEGEERYSEYSYEATDKNIDRILDLNRNNDRHTEEEAPRLKLFISAVSEDLSNMRVVLDELNRHAQVGDFYMSVKEQLTLDLKGLVQGSQVLIDELQKDRTESSEAVTKEETMSEATRDDSAELEILKVKNMELAVDKERIELLLKKYQEQEKLRQDKMDMLDAQLLEFGRELEEMQKSNEHLEGLLGVVKAEKQHLEQLVKDVNEENKVDVEKFEYLSRRLMELEKEVNNLEVQREDYLLERCVAENLARDLSKRVKGIACGSQSDSDEKLDFICQMKELRRSFSLLLASRQESEEDLCVRSDASAPDEIPSRTDVNLVDPDEVSRLQEELEKKALELDVLDRKVVELTSEKGKVDTAVKSYMDQVEAREVRMDQLEAKLLEFARELDHMQTSNDQLESLLEATKAEKQRLEILIQDMHAQNKQEAQDSDAHLQRVVELEALTKRLEEENEAYVLDRKLAESLAQDLTEQLQPSDYHGEDAAKCQQQDLASSLQKLRTRFDSVVKKVQWSEDQLQELRSRYNSLEDRLVKDHEKAVANIAFLDEQFGQLSRESDQRLEACTQELEALLARLEKEQEEKRSQGFLRVALEENVCEIAYLRDELRRVKEDNAAMTREREKFKTEIQSLEAESIQWQSTLEELQEQFEHLQGAEGTTTRLRKTEEALNALVAENKRLEEELERKATEHCVEKSEWQARFTEFQEKLEQLEGFARADEQEILSKLEALTADLETTMNSLLKLRTEKAKMDVRLDKLLSENECLAEQKAATELAVANLESELQQCKALIVGLKENVLNSETQLQAACVSREDTTDKCSRLTGEVEVLKGQLFGCNKIRREISILEGAIEDMVRGLEGHWKSIHQDLQLKESRLYGKLLDLETRYNKTRVSFDAVVSELAKCKLKNSEIEENLQIQTEEKGRAEQETLDLRKQVLAMETKLLELDHQKEEEARPQQLGDRNSQQIVTDGITRKACEKSDNLVATSTQTECMLEEVYVTPSCNENSDGRRESRRKWKPQNSDQENDFLAKIGALEAEVTSKDLYLSSTIAKSQEREATLCEKIVHLEASKKILEEEAASRRDNSELLVKALAEVEECKVAGAEHEKTIARLQSQVESSKLLLTEKESEYARLLEAHEELKVAVAEFKEKHAQLTQAVASEKSEKVEASRLRIEFQEKEALLWKKIEYLEMANEQLAGQQVDSGAEQLKRELTRLQNHNSELTRREHELTSKLKAYELLQPELQRLQEENEQLEQRFLKVKDASLWGDTLERLVYLETELAQAMEANSMYKLQLQSVFAKSVPGAAAQGMSEVEGIIASLVNSKKQTVFLEGELKEMQERYLSMSMRYAEIQSEKEELVMTVKALKSVR